MAEDHFRVRRSPVPLPDDLAAEEQPFAPYPGTGPGPTRPMVPGSPAGPGYGQPSSSDSYMRRLRGRFIQIPFTVGAAAILLRPEESGRNYFFILNFSAALQVFVGFDTAPSAVNGVTLAANLGFYEPWIVPTNAIFVAGSGAGATGMLIISVGP